MPLYEYACEACGQRFESIRKFSDPPLETCRVCGKGPVEKLLSSPAIQFKGEGWYVTDYAGKGKPDATSSEKKPAKGSESKAETKSETKTDSKAETKTETKSETKAKADPSPSKKDSASKTT